jgi:hypothetical protein
MSETTHDITMKRMLGARGTFPSMVLTAPCSRDDGSAMMPDWIKTAVAVMPPGREQRVLQNMVALTVSGQTVHLTRDQCQALSNQLSLMAQQLESNEKLNKALRLERQADASGPGNPLNMLNPGRLPA